MTHMIALVYNWWNLFVRLAIPHKYHETVTSRALLLSSVGRLTEHSRKKKIVITNTHGDIFTLKLAYTRLVDFIDELRKNSPQLSSYECWKRTLSKAMEKFKGNLMCGKYTGLPAPA